ncbi:Aste57867_15494 [Aphanomyces stellatus]|uniref:Aste57867_15494 protein n=1 Tax=Aphanomyces stellatus TaxID=120398 RepID=A0A485L4L7_9STRA|nr:hypothetical protein As57867_015438 [Aphanomyces stellatus]VFT92296.1 Aste57867_15494 [Aphanomyces stellatus]
MLHLRTSIAASRANDGRKLGKKICLLFAMLHRVPPFLLLLLAVASFCGTVLWYSFKIMHPDDAAMGTAHFRDGLNVIHDDSSPLLRRNIESRPYVEPPTEFPPPNTTTTTENATSTL